MDGINSNTYILRRMDHYIEWYYDDGDALLCFTAQRQSKRKIQNTKHNDGKATDGKREKSKLHCETKGMKH